jgi:quercetin dioxygenase-like cupin family protein
VGLAADPAQGTGIRREVRSGPLSREEGTMKKENAAAAVIRNVVETPWQQYPGHFGGALSKPLVRPETTGSRLVDYRISTYQPMAYVDTHTHKVQEQIYHVLEGEGSMEIEGRRQIVRRHDVIFIPPGVAHSIRNDGLTDLTFIVVTTPVEDK